MTKLDIQIVQEPGERGRKAIMVAGEQWGRARMESHGPNGICYFFEDMAGNVLGTNEKGRRGMEQFRAFNLVGDKIARRRTRGGEPEPAPLQQRMHAAVAEWIKLKLLRSPADVRADADRERERYQASVTAAEKAEQAELEAKAKETIESLVGWNCPKIAPEDIATMVAAFRWAQTK